MDLTAGCPEIRGDRIGIWFGRDALVVTTNQIECCFIGTDLPYFQLTFIARPAPLTTRLSVQGVERWVLQQPNRKGCLRIYSYMSSGLKLQFPAAGSIEVRKCQ